MSLLNDMLRDLSHQQKPVDALSTGASPTLDLSAQEQRELFNQSSAAKPLPRSLLPSVLVFVVVFAIAIAWQYITGKHIAVKQPDSAETQQLPEQHAVQPANAPITESTETQTAIQQKEIIASEVPVAAPSQPDPELATRLAALEAAVNTLTNTVVENKTATLENADVRESSVALGASVAVDDPTVLENVSVSVKDPFGLDETPMENRPENIATEQHNKKSHVVQALSDEPAHLEIAPNPKWKDEEHAREARELVMQGQVSIAIEKLQGFIASAQQPRESVKTLLDILVEQNDIAATQRILAQADFLSSHEQAYYQAKILVNQQQEDMAIELLETHLADADKDENYRALLAGLYQKNGKSLEAANHYRRLLAMFGDKPAYWLGFALSQDALNQPQVALQAYQRVNQYTDLPPQVRTYIQQRLAALQQ
ncbi:hypothetical protein [Cellvibrio sp. UBA7661]|uniref:hypothetical protein n=1 Tax=Cellvibrio sp. UBA7661 TaxID=1946311 RepID=UPI002F354D7C